jgi:MerR family redox-sensitive transcriptional activator SoxR
VTLSISEVAARSGLRVSAIRYYEQQCLVQSVGRQSGKRFFDGSVLARLAAIEVAKAAGLSLTEIRSVFSGAATGERPPWGRGAPGNKREI